MGFMNILFGQIRPSKPKREQFFSIVPAESSLHVRSDLHSTQKAGIVFNPVESTFFQHLDTEIRNQIGISSRPTEITHKVVDDSYGTRWVVLENSEFKDLATKLHLVGETITQNGYGSRLIAAVFGFQYEGCLAYWVYNIKRGTFYPIVPVSKQERDNSAEMRLGSLMEQENVPLERDLEQWYALWDIPF